jgi:hypothetical protein
VTIWKAFLVVEREFAALYRALQGSFGYIAEDRSRRVAMPGLPLIYVIDFGKRARRSRVWQWPFALLPAARALRWSSCSS